MDNKEDIDNLSNLDYFWHISLDETLFHSKFIENWFLFLMNFINDFVVISSELHLEDEI